MKRSMADGAGGEFLTMVDKDLANCLLFLSHPPQKKPRVVEAASDPFECKTCGRRFSSFQALGGHRASHKLTLKPSSARRPPEQPAKAISAAKSRMHECSICGLGFAMGQALGGHMRKHRTDLMNTSMYPVANHGGMALMPVVLKRTNSSKRIAGCLDLNLTPLENDLKLMFGNVSPNIQQQLQTHPRF
ncbi:hypothetical protein MLD38_040746 [Melastoma candidum]|nr:hypothetical protein MLD38_040746 [Melastoma candidum]